VEGRTVGRRRKGVPAIDALEIVLCGTAAFCPSDEEGLDLAFRFSPERQKLAIWKADEPEAERWENQPF
jgi:hypothetical protein